jgi:hypothetical protein
MNSLTQRRADLHTFGQQFKIYSMRRVIEDELAEATEKWRIGLYCCGHEF